MLLLSYKRKIPISGTITPLCYANYEKSPKNPVLFDLHAPVSISSATATDCSTNAGYRALKQLASIHSMPGSAVQYTTIVFGLAAAERINIGMTLPSIQGVHNADRFNKCFMLSTLYYIIRYAEFGYSESLTRRVARPLSRKIAWAETLWYYRSTQNKKTICSRLPGLLLCFDSVIHLYTT